MTFAAAFFKYDKTKENLQYRGSPGFYYTIRELLKTFGYFEIDIEHFSATEWTFWLTSLLLTTIIVLNLAIARMGDSLALWNETNERHSYY
jgi:hypothetical protein